MVSAVAIVGVFVLVGLAAAVGVLDTGSRRAGWNRLASQRRRQAAHARMLDEREARLATWENQLVRAAECEGCAVCELRRRRGERPTG